MMFVRVLQKRSTQRKEEIFQNQLRLGIRFYKNQLMNPTIKDLSILLGLSEEMIIELSDLNYDLTRKERMLSITSHFQNKNIL